MKRKAGIVNRNQAIGWLPIDSRLISPLVSFGHVRGVAKVFLIVEIVLSVGVVVGSVSLFILSLFSLQ